MESGVDQFGGSLDQAVHLFCIKGEGLRILGVIRFNRQLMYPTGYVVERLDESMIHFGQILLCSDVFAKLIQT